VKTYTEKAGWAGNTIQSLSWQKKVNPKRFQISIYVGSVKGFSSGQILM
jgi:hypothetical protein